MERLDVLRLKPLILGSCFLLWVVRLLLYCQLSDFLLQEVILPLEVLDLQQQ
jgi:hypothetical protein